MDRQSLVCVFATSVSIQVRPSFVRTGCLSQRRRSARLASLRARAAQPSSVPEPIPPVAAACIECGLELESEDEGRQLLFLFTSLAVFGSTCCGS